MTAHPILAFVARALKKVNLDAVLIGNAGAALHGVPVTTIDLDFFIRRTPANVQKLKALAIDIDAVMFRPYYPVSGLFRLMRNPDNLQLDFMTAIHGPKSFEGVRSRSTEIEVGGQELHVASLADIVASKRAANRPRDLAVLAILENALDENSGKEHEEKAARPAKPGRGARGPQKRK